MKLSFKQTALLAAAFVTTLAGAASIAAGKVGLVDVQSLIGNTSAGPTFAAIGKKADTDLAAQVKAIQALQDKIGSGKGTAADQQALAKAQAAYQAAARDYDAQRQKAFAPVAKTVNAAVAAAAKAQGYTVILDKRKVAGSGLVIYANAQTTDITAAVQKALKK